MTTRTVTVSYATPFGAGDLGQPWALPGNAASPDGSVAVSSVDADALIADTVTDLLARDITLSPLPQGSALVGLALTVRAWSAGSKGTAALTTVRFVAGAYDSGNLAAAAAPLSTSAQDFHFDLANAPTLPLEKDLRHGGRWSVRFGALTGSCAVAVDALDGPTSALLRLRPGGLLSRDFRSRNFRGR